MDVIVLAAALTLSLAGCLFVYVSSPNQQLRSKRPSSVLIALLLGGLLGAAGLGVFASTLGLWLAVAVWSVWLMFAFTALPFAGALAAALRGDR